VLLGRVEAREVAADDFFLAVALDALGARVPVGDDAFRRQHVDRVIGHALHQQAEALLALAQLVLGLLALGDVAGHLGKAEQQPFLVVDGVDDDVGPEAGAVLAHAPALGFILAVIERGLQRARRQAGTAVFVGIEARKVLAQDLLRDVALEPVGARVPAAHVPLRVEHVDRIVVDAGNQVLVAPLIRQDLFLLHVFAHGSLLVPGCTNSLIQIHLIIHPHHWPCPHAPRRFHNVIH
jgi:hypothetical protein